MKIDFTQDTKSQSYLDAIRIRRLVFVEEQLVPLDIEIDEHEAQCTHFVLYENNGLAVATARFLPDREHEGVAILQRMAVLKEYRGKGRGGEVIRAVESFALSHHIYEIVLHAQLTAKGFYEKKGYAAFGDEFEEAGITHVSMKKRIL
ncbi:GNAT family acetyltransferase [Bacteroidia bacterium]|nr:GNAT family acetyltransferase [Bacteroidia bacterium]